MKSELHPQWYTEARVTCACGNTWVTGSTIPEIRTDVCSNCHPFYTGEQRIVDTEGQVDRFLKRLRARDEIRATQEADATAHKSPDQPIAILELGTRIESALESAGVTTIGDIVAIFEEQGDAGLLDLKGFGRKALIDLKRAMRTLGIELTEPEVG